MKKYAILFLYLLISQYSSSENYHGKVVSGKDSKGVQEATIQFFNKNVFVGGGRSSADGTFSISTGQAATRVSVSCIGMGIYTRKDSLGLPENLGFIRMQSQGVRLGEVTVTASLRREQADKDIYLITDSLRKGTASSAQLVERIPGILRDWENDNLRINGETDIVILVNDVEKGKDYAMRINPKRIKQVEITYNPMGKYEGHRVLMNISLYDDYIGWDLAPYTNLLYGRNGINEESVGLSYTYSVNKLSLNLTTSLTNSVKKESNEFSRAYGDGWERNSQPLDRSNPNRRADKLGYNVSLGAEYLLHKDHRLSLQGNGSFNQSLDSTLYHVTEQDGSNINQYDQWNKDKYYSDDYNVGLFYRGKFGKDFYVNSDLTYDYYRVKERRSFLDGAVLSSQPTLGDKHHVFFGVNLSKPICKMLDFYADYRIAWRKYSDKDKNVDATSYWSRNMRHYLLGLLTFHPIDNFSLGGGAFWFGNSDKNSSGHTSQYFWGPWVRLYCKPWRPVTVRGDFHVTAMYPNLDQLTATEYRIDSHLVHGGNPLLKSSTMRYMDFMVSIDRLFTLRFATLNNKDMNQLEYYSQLPDGMVKESYVNMDWHRMGISLFGDYRLFRDFNLGVTASYQHDDMSKDGSGKRKGDGFSGSLQARYTLAPLKLGIQGSYELEYTSIPYLQGRYQDHEDAAKLTLARTFAKGRFETSLTVRTPVNLIKPRYGTEITLPYFMSVTRSSLLRSNGPYVSLGMRLYLHGGKQVRMSYNQFNIDQEK